MKQGQFYKGYTIFVDNENFGLEHSVTGEGIIYSRESKVYEGWVKEDYFNLLKFILDNPFKEDL